MWIGQRKEIRKLKFPSLALRRYNQIILLYFPPTQHHNFFRNLPLYSWNLYLTNGNLNLI